MLGYLFTSRSLTLYILYTLHVMLGTSLVFTALYTYGVHSSKAMAREANAKAQLEMARNEIAVLDSGDGNASSYASGLNEEKDIAGARRVKSMVGLSGRGGWENGTQSAMEEVVKFREICYTGRSDGGLGAKDSVEMEMPGFGGGRQGMALEVS